MAHSTLLHQRAKLLNYYEFEIISELNVDLNVRLKERLSQRFYFRLNAENLNAVYIQQMGI